MCDMDSELLVGASASALGKLREVKLVYEMPWPNGKSDHTSRRLARFTDRYCAWNHACFLNKRLAYLSDGV